MNKTYTEIYKLNPNITSLLLKKYGFLGGRYYRKNVYKNLIQLEIEIDLTEKYFTYTVYDLPNNQVYFPYYDDYFGGKNKVLKEVRKAIKRVFIDLENKNILIKEKSIKNENCR